MSQKTTIDFKDMFVDIDRWMVYLGLKEFYLREKTGTKKFQLTQLTIFLICYINIIISGGSEILYAVFLENEDFTEWILLEAEICPLTIVAVYSVMKTTIMIYQRSRLMTLVEELRALWPKEEDGPDLYQVYQDNIKWTQKICSFYVTLTMVTGFMYNLFPFFAMAFNVYTTGHTDYLLPYYVWYPFGWDPVKTIPRYIFIYITHFLGGSYVTASMSGIDSIFCTLVAMITVHFMVLCKKLKELSTNIDRNDPSQLQNRLRSVVDLHNKLIVLTKNVEAIYTLILLFTLLGSSFLICLLLFSVTIAPAIKIPRYVTILTSTLIQITMMSYYGDWLLQESDSVSQAIYESDWADLGDTEHNKDVVMIMVRTQKEVGVSAMGFAVFSMTTITSILGGAWTYFSLINTMYEQT